MRRCLVRAFGVRLVNTSVIVAVGHEGLIPFVYLFVLQGAMTRLVLMFASKSTRGLLCLDRAGFAEWWQRIHGVTISLYFRCIPNLSSKLLRWTKRGSEHDVLVRFTGAFRSVIQGAGVMPVANSLSGFLRTRSNVERGEGVAVLTIGTCNYVYRRACKLLKRALIDPMIGRFVKPLDWRLLSWDFWHSKVICRRMVVLMGGFVLR